MISHGKALPLITSLMSEVPAKSPASRIKSAIHRLLSTFLLVVACAGISVGQVVLQGTVTDRNTLVALPGAFVTSCPDPKCSLTTADANGQYSLTAGQLNNATSGYLYISSHGYFTTMTAFNITTTPTTLDVSLLPGGTLLTGTITDANTGLPVAGARVQLGRPTIQLAGNNIPTTDNSGHYAFDSSLFFENAAPGFDVTTGLIVYAAGYFNYQNNISFHVGPPYPTTQDAAVTSTGVSSSVTVSTTPPGLAITVDAVPGAAPQMFFWVPSNAHTIATSSPQIGGTGIQYAFSNWSNGGAISQTIVSPASNTTYTASFATP